MVGRSELMALRWAWDGLKQRCDNPNNKDYPDYGGRGITYSEDWKVFANFKRDMSPRPSGLTLDRKDVNGNYCKENCRWASRVTQGGNRRPFAAESSARSNSPLEVPGITLTPQGSYLVRATQRSKRVRLYLGRDFFQAVCARKSWENSYNNSIQRGIV